MSAETIPQKRQASTSSARAALLYRGRWAWLGLILSLGLIFVLSNSAILDFIPPEWRYYMIFPLSWLGLGGMGWWAWRYTLVQPPRLDRGLFILALMGGLVQVSISFLCGMVWSFGRSPYAHAFPPVLGNLFFIASSLVGLEMTRAYLMARGRSVGVFLLITVLFALIVIPLGFYERMKDLRSTIEALGTEVLPQVAESLFATYLVWLGGPFAGMAYRGALLGFEWFSPILPRLPWLVQAFVGTTIPVVLLLILYQITTVQERDASTTRSQAKAFHWTLIVLLAVSLLWFNAGFFGVRPYLVSGVSMQPTYSAGDVVIVLQVPKETIQVGDVILFRHNKVAIMHRVVAIQEQNGQRVFITKGDNNNTLDEPVTAEEYGGKAVMRIPKVGWVAILFRKVLAWAF
jgi:signal peptidase